MLTNELVLAINTAIKAGKPIMKIFEKGINRIILKNDGSPVTDADNQSQQCIIECLQTSPWPVLSEEGDPDDWQRIKSHEKYWLIDPLDGTREFINGDDEFTINIALVEKERPVLGVILLPSRGELYAGATGTGAWHLKYDPDSNAIDMEELKKNGTMLPIVKRNSSFIIVGSKHNLTPDTNNLIAKISQSISPVAVSRVGSAVKFCKIATGEADIYPRMDPIMEWDTAAGHALVEAAGGWVKRWPGGEQLFCNSPDLKNPCFIAIAPGRDVSMFF